MGEYFKSKRGTFEGFEKGAITLCGSESYLVTETKRNRKEKHPADGSTIEITQENCRENIRRIFIEIIDNIVESLENKIIVYVKICTKFNFFSNLENLTDSEIKNAADSLQKAYPEDLESYLYEELLQFSYFLNEKRSGINVAEREICIYQFVKKDWASVFPSIEIPLLIYLSM